MNPITPERGIVLMTVYRLTDNCFIVFLGAVFECISEFIVNFAAL